MKNSGIVLRIEKISLNDGNGMRTVVFLKGCPMRCAWCSTPESQHNGREVYYMKQRCRMCGACLKVCSSGALGISEDGSFIYRDRELCTNCFSCVDVCNYRAQQIYGKEMTAEQVMREIEKDEMFYFYSGGGVTLSGGDIFCQTDFAESILLACEDACIDTCAELDMLTSPANVERIIPHLDMFYADIKSMDDENHRRWTGQSNRTILKNIRLASDICKPGALHIRVPLVEDINDSETNIMETAEFCRSLSNCSELEFLPYHSLGTHAYEQLNRDYPLADRKPMNRYDVWKKVNFLCEEDLPFNIRISGMKIYEAGTGPVSVTKEELEA